jgi:regulator of PEP synthase PpsR (kinase-PPPase family)
MRPPPRLRSQTSPGTASHGHLGRSIFVVSDATGETAERVVRAALRQFDLGELPIDLRVFPHLRHEHDVDTVVAEARAVGALLVSTLVRAEERSLLHKKCDERGVQCVDLIGSLLGRLASYFSVQPRGIPGLLHTVSDEYYQRMEAIEFTVQSDDGRDPQSLQRADLVLVGISRTSKTPLSIYLAQKGYKVANVPLVLDLPPPPELFELQRPPPRRPGRARHPRLCADHPARRAATDPPRAPAAPAHDPRHQLRAARLHPARNLRRPRPVQRPPRVASHRHHRQSHRRNRRRHPPHLHPPRLTS